MKTIDNKHYYDFEEFMEALGIKRTLAYKLVREDPVLEAFKLNGTWWIPEESLGNYIKAKRKKKK